jgi:hypothetical protein
MTPQEGWGFTAQQAVEKLLKVMIVLRDVRPPSTHLLNVLAQLAQLAGAGAGFPLTSSAALCGGGAL